MAKQLDRRLVNVVTILFIMSVLAPVVSFASAQESGTPVAVEQVAPPQEPGTTETAVVQTEPSGSSTTGQTSEGSALDPVEPTASQPPDDPAEQVPESSSAELDTMPTEINTEESAETHVSIASASLTCEGVLSFSYSSSTDILNDFSITLLDGDPDNPDSRAIRTNDVEQRRQLAPLAAGSDERTIQFDIEPVTYETIFALITWDVGGVSSFQGRTTVIASGCPSSVNQSPSLAEDSDASGELTINLPEAVTIDWSREYTFELDQFVSGGVPPYTWTANSRALWVNASIVDGDLVLSAERNPYGVGEVSLTVQDSRTNAEGVLQPSTASGSLPIRIVEDATPLTASADWDIVTHPGMTESVYIKVEGGGSSTLMFEIVTPPNQGSAMPVEPEPGNPSFGGRYVTYTANSDAVGQDTFTVRISRETPGPVGASYVDVTVKVLIRPSVTIDNFSCQGTITYTIASGDWIGDHYAFGTDLFFSISSSPQSTLRPQEEARLLVPYEGSGTFTVQLDLRPGDYSTLTARISPTGASHTITDCMGGGNPELEPWSEIVIHGLSCDGIVSYTVTNGYLPPYDGTMNTRWSLSVDGQYLAGEEVVRIEPLGSAEPVRAIGNHQVETGLDLANLDYDRFWVYIGLVEGIDPRYRAVATFDECSNSLPDPPQATLQTTLTLCANDACTPPYDLSADGYEVSWTVTGEGDPAAVEAVNNSTLASIAPMGAGVNLRTMRAAQPLSLTMTAVIQGGVATGLSEPIPVGSYTVCLNPLIIGPNDQTIRIASQPICEAVELTEEGNGSTSGSGDFTVILDPPIDPGDQGDTSTPLDRIIEQLVRLLIAILTRILGGYGFT